MSELTEYVVWNTQPYIAKLVVGDAAMRRAWLDRHWDEVDPENLTDEQKESLSWLDDGNNWIVEDGRGCMCEMRHEDSTVGVLRINCGRLTSKLRRLP